MDVNALIGPLALAIGVFTVVLVGVTLSRPRSRLNTYFAAFIAVFGGYIASGQIILLAFGSSSSGAMAHGLAGARQTIGPLIVPLYLLLLGQAVKTRGTSWLRSKRGEFVLLALMPISMTIGYMTAVQLNLLWALLFDVPIILTAIFAAIVAIAQWLKAPMGSAGRRVAGSYLLAFGCHDAGIFVAILQNLITYSGGSNSAVFEFLPLLSRVLLLSFFVILSIAVFRGQILDFDRKLHIGISRATLGAIFIAVFVGAQTLVSEFFTSTSGLLAGAMAAGGLVLGLTPLQRLAEGVANRAAPRGGQMDAEVSAAFYKEQVAIAYSDGVLGAKERNALRNVRERLQLDPGVALQIEDAVVAAA